MAKKKVSLTRSRAMKESWARRRSSPMREQTRKRVTQPKPKLVGEPKFWILWMPLSNKPPRVRFGTLEKVMEVADIMVQKYHNPIYVMEAVQLHKYGKPEVVPCNGPNKEDQKAKPCSTETFQVSSTPAPLANQGQWWNQEMDGQLTMLWYSYSKDIEILAEKMGRSELAIEYRLDKLGIRPRQDS